MRFENCPPSLKLQILKLLAADRFVEAKTLYDLVVSATAARTSRLTSFYLRLCFFYHKILL